MYIIYIYIYICCLCFRPAVYQKSVAQTYSGFINFNNIEIFMEALLVALGLVVAVSLRLCLSCSSSCVSLSFSLPLFLLVPSRLFVCLRSSLSLSWVSARSSLSSLSLSVVFFCRGCRGVSGLGLAFFSSSLSVSPGFVSFVLSGRSSVCRLLMHNLLLAALAT